MVLVDTSIWIRFLSNRDPYTQQLDRLLELDDVAAHEMVYGELLVGDRGGRKSLLESYEKMYRAKTVPHRDVVGFIRHRKLQGRGAGWIDMHLLASALVDRCLFWTADANLSSLAVELGIAWQTGRIL